MVWRGLPSDLALAAPAVTAWIHSLRDGDPFLREECGVVLLGEVASVTVRHPVYDELPEVPYQYKELLGAIWREPLTGHLAPGERARTLASLLHTDPRGRSFTAELVVRSGLAPAVWLQHLFSALLPPLLRFLYRYGTVFSPHGENAIVIFDEHDVPVRLAVKGFVDDVNISAEPLPELAAMPEEVRAVLLAEPADHLPQFIHREALPQQEPSLRERLARPPRAPARRAVRHRGEPPVPVMSARRCGHCRWSPVGLAAL